MVIDGEWKNVLWGQLGASIDMLGNAIRVCPDEGWNAGPTDRAFWYLAYHTLFFLDLYTYGSVEGFSVPPPFTLDELDPAGVYPERAFSRGELLAYQSECRIRVRYAVASLTPELAARHCTFAWREASYAELLLTNLRHVQHHTAQLHWILRQITNSAPPWVATAVVFLPLQCDRELVILPGNAV